MTRIYRCLYAVVSHGEIMDINMWHPSDVYICSDQTCWSDGHQHVTPQWCLHVQWSDMMKWWTSTCGIPVMSTYAVVRHVEVMGINMWHHSDVYICSGQTWWSDGHQHVAPQWCLHMQWSDMMKWWASTCGTTVMSTCAVVRHGEVMGINMWHHSDVYICSGQTWWSDGHQHVAPQWCLHMQWSDMMKWWASTCGTTVMSTYAVVRHDEVMGINMWHHSDVYMCSGQTWWSDGHQHVAPQWCLHAQWSDMMKWWASTCGAAVMMPTCRAQIWQVNGH